ncbi:similar to Saccharomyces cerevisiae YHR097C Putative protein of unknown function [Maudiozyma barnettii]|uniref:Protein PAL1 n=1 Tax=Maudiozyma barnettii TaxID=61262 RepID=A0A8H2VDW2_9SACH|nr:uncharacterized protein KABA2_03S05126 [Kazachstania barnettii]CAB4253775.1 similar to Saccharomyces cerevisiae YHR097C Putative protein of unknown function [Kazachstania barnettii]CAD1781524.1 similar to Saccharomyces cerevisiae YHR097C Putative protein of unknown function [Kazachstania barnettii]
MQSSWQTPSSTGTSRPFSTTNPFRTSVAVEANPNRYDHDPQFQEWARDQFNRDSTSSNPSFDSSGINVASPPSKSSTNPFLDDDDEESESDSGDEYVQRRNEQLRNHDYNSQSNRGHYVSAKEEKDKLRQRYIEERNVDDTRTPSALRDMPPTYDEVSHNRRDTSGKSYPEEKRSSRSHSGPHNSNISSSGSRGGEGHVGSERPRARHGHSSYERQHDRRGSEHRHSGSSSAAKRDKRKSKLIPAKGVDTIDKLDVTGLFGGSFHHDGPFDACTPHRNKNSKAAPVMAFPADGPNSTIGGTFRKKSAIDEVFGVDDADDDLYQTKGGNSSKDAIRTNIDGLRQMDAKSKAEKVHGPTTSGLGSTTFLDGAPAPSRTIQRGQSMSYRQTSFNSNGSGNNASIRRNMTISSRPTASPQGGRTPNDFSRNRNNSPSFKTHSSFGDDEDDVYLGGNTGGGVRFDSGTKKSSTGNKFLKRVKSLKVGGKKH